MRIDREKLKQRISGSLYARSREDEHEPLFECEADEYARDVLAAIEPILAAAEGMREAIEVIKPIELRQGDAAQYDNPQARQMLNSNVTWGVTPSSKSAHQVKSRMDGLGKALAAFDTATATQPGAGEGK